MNIEQLNNKLAQMYPSLSPVNKKIAGYLKANPDDMVFYNIVSLSEKLKINPSSIVKFSQLLGLKGFKELRSIYLKYLVKSSVDGGFSEKHSALRQANSQIELATESVFADIIKQDTIALNTIAKEIKAKDIDKAVELLAQADNIFIAGQLRSASIANWLHYTLTMLGKKNYLLIDGAEALLLEQAKFIKDNDVLISISFQFYSDTVIKMTEIARQQNSKVITITDGDFSPLLVLSDVCFSLPDKEYLFSKSLTATMSLVLTLTTCLAQKYGKN